MEAFIVAGAAVLIFIGGALYLPKTPVVTVGTNSTDLAECDGLYTQWDTRRQERCNAEAAERSAREVVKSLTTQFAVLAGVAAAAWLAYYAASSSFYTAWLAAVLLVVAIAATVTAVFAAGELTAANMDAGNKATVAQNARNAEAQARELMIRGCKDPERIDAYLLRPSPC